jgi:hypothetical protein
MTCDGAATMMLFCNLNACQPEAEWTPWSKWSECNSKCDKGQRQRKRKCESINDASRRKRISDKCEGGSDEESEACIGGPCSQWTEWGEWLGCSITCGKGGVKKRERLCKQVRILGG